MLALTPVDLDSVAVIGASCGAIAFAVEEALPDLGSDYSVN
jgi:hypothetical protein